MYDLLQEPTWDVNKQRGGWLPRELPEVYFPDRAIIARQGFQAGAGGNHVPRSSLSLSSLLAQLPRVQEFMEENKAIPSEITLRLPAGPPHGRGQGGPRGQRSSVVNPAEFLYLLAHAVRTAAKSQSAPNLPLRA